MSTSKHIDRFCAAAVAVSLVLTILFMCGGSLGLTAAAKTVKYASTLFDTSYVHQIDIVMDDWDSFIETCENEEYATCTVVVDGKKHANIAIRAKGNTSLSSVRSSGSQRYSFKLEFDHNESGKTLDGLDKLCLNNLIQDNTMMKDYLVYRLMADFGADSPLCSYAYLTVNGEDWGLYLAIEGVEDSFLARNYGSDTGELYKPDSLSFGGGRGNGKDFNFDDLDFDFSDAEAGQQGDPAQDGGQPGGFPGGQFPGQPGGDGQQSGFPSGGQFPGQPGGDGQPGGFPSDGQFPGQPGGDGQQGGFPSDGQFPGQPGGDGQPGGFPSDGQFPGQPGGDGQPGGFGGMGSDDVKLKYIDDDPDSYSNIFSSAKTDVSKADQARLISSLKQLSAYENLEDILDTDEVLRYFVVHNFVCNGDSYTGSMIHNYYLHEKDGKLGMIPWDYNLAYGTFQGGNASSTVNASIDSLVSGSLDDRPMVGWIFSDETYTEQYHALFAEFLSGWFSNGELEQLIEDTAAMLRPYVEKDPTKFCTTEEFEAGVAALSQFVSLRAEAVNRQLKGDSAAVETGDLNLSDMGSMGGGRGGAPDSARERPEGFDGTFPNGFSGDPPGGAGSQPPTAADPGSTEASGSDGAAASEKPDDSAGRPSRGKTQNQSGFPGGSGERPSRSDGSGFSPRSSAQGGSGTETTLILLGVSVLALAAGLIVAVKKKY